MTQSDAGLNALDWMARGALAESGLVETTVDSLVGPQTCFSGGAGEALVFLHGAGDHAGSWARVAPMFTAKYRVIVVDGAGRGTSGPYKGALGMEEMLAGLDAVIAEAPHRTRATLHRGGAESGEKQERGNAAATFVGNSLGAWTAMAWALMHPDRVRRIVAVNGGPVTGLRADLTLTPADREEARRLWEAMVDTAHYGVPDVVLDELIRKGKVGALSRMSIASLQPYLLDGRLAEITVPVDLVWGESDQLIPLEYARRLANELPRARLTTIAGCGHMPHLECAERFTETLRAVLEREP